MGSTILTAAHEDPAPDRWPATQQLIILSVDDDADVARMAGTELLCRLGLGSALRVEHDGKRRIIRRDS